MPLGDSQTLQKRRSARRKLKLNRIQIKVNPFGSTYFHLNDLSVQSTMPERAPSIPQPENFTRASPSMSQIPQQADLSTVPGVAQYQAAPNPNFPYFSQLQPNNQQAMSTMPYVIPTQMYQQGHLPKITSAADHFGHEGTRIAKELARNFQVISPHMMNAMPAQMMGNTMALQNPMQAMPQLSQHQLQQLNQYQMQMASLQNSAMVQQAQQAPPVQQNVQQPPNPQQQQQQSQPSQQPPQQQAVAPPPQLQNPLLQQQHQQNTPQQSRSIPVSRFNFDKCRLTCSAGSIDVGISSKSPD